MQKAWTRVFGGRTSANTDHGKQFVNELEKLNSQNWHESMRSANAHVRVGAEAGLSDACRDDRRGISPLCDVCVCACVRERVNGCAYCKNRTEHGR